MASASSAGDAAEPLLVATCDGERRPLGGARGASVAVGGKLSESEDLEDPPRLRCVLGQLMLEIVYGILCCAAPILETFSMVLHVTHYPIFEVPVQPPNSLKAAVALPDRTFMPVFTSRTSPHHAKMGLVIVHGLLRDADNYFMYAFDAATRAGREEATMIVSPWFPRVRLTKAQWTGHVRDKGTLAAWSMNSAQWMMGYSSNRYRFHRGVSSFAAMDAIISWLGTTCPNLEQIIVTGFSAGSQYGLRWSALSVEGTEGTASLGIPLRAIWGGSSSYLYFDGLRPATDPCNLEETAGRIFNCSSFGPPDKNCYNMYNCYPYGLDCLAGTSSQTVLGEVRRYLAPFAESEGQLRRVLPARFATKDVRFIFGSRDTWLCAIRTCSRRCAAMLEGQTRLQRGLNYMAHLREAIPGYEPIYGVYTGGHRPELFLASQFFNAWAFDSAAFSPCWWYLPWCWTVERQLLLIGHLACVVALCYWSCWLARGQRSNPRIMPLSEETSDHR